MRPSGLIALVAIVAFSAAADRVGAQEAVSDKDWPRFHIGVAAGASRLGADTSDAGVPEDIWGNTSADSGTGWKIVAGLRPIRIVGVEIQFVDFGEGQASAHAGELLGGGQVTFWERTSSMTAIADATVLSALLFIPESSPSIDVYGKVGVADFDESLTAVASKAPVFNPATLTFECQPVCLFANEVDHSGSAAYVGFGARFKIARAAGVRVEYEAIDREAGDHTAMFSLGVAFEW